MYLYLSKKNMIDTNKVSFNFIKKEPFTGSDSGMRYRLEKHSEGEEDYILVHVWPEPYNFVSTEDALKTSETFPLTPEGKEEAVDWLNFMLESKAELWNRVKDKPLLSIM